MAGNIAYALRNLMDAIKRHDDAASDVDCYRYYYLDRHINAVESAEKKFLAEIIKAVKAEGGAE
jgi:hypothetical protein